VTSPRPTHAADVLADAVRRKHSALVLGLDPRPEQMPVAYHDGVAGVIRFHARLIELLAPHVIAIKPQIAFFEALGVDGLRAYAGTGALGRAAGLVVIGDVKRGDVGSTAEAYARAHYQWADWLTVNPYLGDDSLEPFLAFCRERGKGVFVLCATSNPGWQRFQAAKLADGRPLYEHVAAAIAEWNASCAVGAAGYGPVGAVAGATHPEALRRLRAAMKESWLLLPGVGAQGARLADLAPAFDAAHLGAVVPVSRGLTACFAPDDPRWEAKVVAAAQALVAEYRALP
jgi:orotidine-5'-phosphate decarboxylase